VRRVSLAESVTEQIIAMISEGRIRPGDRLPSELELMKHFNVGRSSVREAIRGLALIGVVERRPRRGTVLVSPLKDLPEHRVKDAIAHWALKDLFDVRALIEGYAAARAATMATPEDLMRIEKQAAAAEAKVRRGRRYFKENIAFHLAIAEAAHNKVLVHLFKEVIGAMRDVRLRFETARDVAEHRAIFEAIKRRDGRRARRLIERHIHDVLQEDVPA
jgi:GntR family transcriptional repressor for pyruvate dehydrogenase complex